MSEMVLRVADAAKKYLHNRADLGAPINYEDLARAVMEEMREPTGAMIEAGAGPCADQHHYKKDVWYRSGGEFLSDSSKQDYRNGMQYGWRAMIDAALKP